MRKLYNLQVTVALDDARSEDVISTARKHYSDAGGGLEVDEDGHERPWPAEEAIECVGDALMELMFTHPAFAGTDIELTAMTCGVESDEEKSAEGSDAVAPGGLSSQSGSSEKTKSADEAVLIERDALDQYETGVYVCRWPNGEFSVVTASTKREAIIALDEGGGAHPSQVYPLDSFMADFRLTDEGEIVLNEFGEETTDIVWDLCYPKLRRLLTRPDFPESRGNRDANERKRILRAVDHERNRLDKDQPNDESSTDFGKRLAKELGTSAVVADHYVEEVAKEILESEDGEEGKPN
jgi:hypothetical protein